MSLSAWNIAAERLLLSVGQVSLTTALVILPLLALRKLLRRRYPARVLCLLWAVLLARLLVPVQLTLPRAPVQVTPHLTRVHYEAPETVSSDAAPAVTAARAEWVETAQADYPENAAHVTCYGVILFAVWGGATLWLLYRQLYIYFRYAGRLRRTALPVQAPEVRAVFEAERERMDIRRKIPLVQSPLVYGPMLIGLAHPMLVLPLAGTETADPFRQAGLCPDSAALVLRHELTHYQRHDLWLKLAAAIARCMHWFNPAVHLLLQALYEDIELACDSRVVEGMDSDTRRRYGEAILDCAASQRAARHPFTTCFTSDKDTLKTRLGELFVTGAKKRGAALLLVCAATVGIVGGAVAFGGTVQPAAHAANRENASGEPLPGEEAALRQETLTEEAAILLGAAWADGWAGRNMETAMPYLSADFQQVVFDSMSDPIAEDGTRFEFDPDDPHYGVPEENRARFWNVGVSSPWIGGRAVLPDLENNGAYIVCSWFTSASPETRTLEYVHFTWEDGAWRVSSVDGSMGQYGGEINDLVDSAEQFRRFYGNDLGLPDCFPYLSYAAADPQSHPLLFPIDSPTEAAVGLLQLEGGSAEITGSVRVQPGSSGVMAIDPAHTAPNPDTADASEHLLGCVVTYTFADGSAVDITMANLYSEGYVPVDWTIDGSNNRTMVDLASQWAQGTREKDTHVMFPLLTVRGAGELIAIQQAYSGTEGNEWYWKHGKYGSSPTAREYGVFIDPDSDENTVRVTYALGSSGECLYRESEILRFVDTPQGLKLDSVRDLVRSNNHLGAASSLNSNYAYGSYSGLEWFRMHYMADPVAGDLSDFKNGFGSYAYGPDVHRPFMDDPLEAAKTLLYLDDNGFYDFEIHADAVLVSKSNASALLRLDFEDGGSVFVEMVFDIDHQRWKIAEIREAEPAEQISSAAAFQEAYTDFDFLGLDAYQSETPLTVSDLAELYHYDRVEGVVCHTDPFELFGQPFGLHHVVEFPDGSAVEMLLAERSDGGLYPVDWSVDGKNVRTLRDLAIQWATGYADKDTKPLYPLLTENGVQQLNAEQDDPGHIFTENNEWDWKLHRYLATVTGYTFRQSGETEAEIVYTEIGRGLCNHSAVQRVSFVWEKDELRIDHWEEITQTTESDYLWYNRYCLPSLHNFTRSIRDFSPGDTDPQKDAEYWAKEFAGLNDHETMQANVQSIEPLHFAEGTGDAPGYEVTLQFTDESGWLVVAVRPGTDEDGDPVWMLHNISLHDRNPDAERWFPDEDEA